MSEHEAEWQSAARRLADENRLLREHLLRAERVCAMVGWTASRSDSEREKAATQVWMEWAHARPEMSRREAWPDLSDEGIAALAEQRDRIRSATLARISNPPAGEDR